MNQGEVIPKVLSIANSMRSMVWFVRSSPEAKYERTPAGGRIFLARSAGKSALDFPVRSTGSSSPGAGPNSAAIASKEWVPASRVLMKEFSSVTEVESLFVMSCSKVTF